MLNTNFIMFYVDNPAISAAFYTKILGQQPCESSPTFAMFLIDNGYKLGLWSKHTVEPAATLSGGGGELGFPVTDVSDVDVLHAAWREEGLTIAQPPTQMDFGYTFVALDPDGHRLRVYALTKQ